MQLTVKDVAGILGVSEKTINRWISSRLMPAYLVNSQYRFSRAQLMEWASVRRMKVPRDIVREPESEDIPLPSLAEALRAGGVFYRLGGSDKDLVLRALVETLPLAEEVDREFLFEVLLAREALASTGVGDDIAVPHVRNQVVQHLRRTTVTLCYLEKPVDFGAIDGKPVRILFSPISPTLRGHLHLLSRLAFTLRDAGFKAILLREGSRDEILAEVRRIEATFARSKRLQGRGDAASVDRSGPVGAVSGDIG